MRDKLHDVSRDLADGLENISDSIKSHPLTAKITENSKLGELMDRQSSSETGHHRPRKRRRTRVSKACDECRVRKIRCDGGQPCEPCEAFERSKSVSVRLLNPYRLTSSLSLSDQSLS